MAANSDLLAKYLALAGRVHTLEENNGAGGASTDDVAELRVEIDALRAGIAAINDGIAALAAQQKEAKPPPIHWADLDHDELAVAWDGLVGWIRDVLVARHPRDANAVLPCWWQHPDAVEALTAGWQTHQAAWAPAGSATDRADWMGRWRTQMTEQVRLALAGCEPERHGHQPQLDPLRDLPTD